MRFVFCVPLVNIFLIYFYSNANAQQAVQGKIIDSLTSLPIAFVNLTLEDGRSGTSTDIEGKFLLSIPFKYQGLIYLSHVSYHSKIFALQFLQNNFTISMQPGSTELSEVEVIASRQENPAFGIIRKVIEQKRHNDPENLRSYELISYNKFLITVSSSITNNDSTSNSIKFNDNFTEHGKDKVELVNLDSWVKSAHLFISESVTEKQVINPGREKERLLALQISGLKSPVFTSLATDYQPFSFYSDHISLLRKDFINPLSRGTFNRYDFFLNDTTYFAKDTVYIIQFQPKSGKRFNGLKGVVSVSSDGYAVKNVIASSVDSEALTRIRIQQNYEKIDGQWFPVQLNTDLDFLNVKFGDSHLIAQQRSFFKNIKINPNLRSKSFGDVKLDLTPIQPNENKIVLDSFRNSELSKKELKTYQWLDSASHKFVWVDKILEAAASQTLPLGNFELDINKFASVNKYEIFRLGIGVFTSNSFSKYLRLGGYAGYGFHDQQWKYGGEIRANLNIRKDFFLRLSYSKDIRETGLINSMQPLFRSWVSSQFDRIEYYKTEVNYMIFQDVYTSVFVSRSDLTPEYTYRLLFNNDLISHFRVTESGLSFKYIKRESFMSLRGKRIFMSSSFPTITLVFSQAFQAFRSQDFNFKNIDLSVRQLIKYRNGGKTYFYLASGWINGVAPYGRLYNGRGSSASTLYVNDYFQTMGLYEFTTTKYASVFAYHNFGNVLLDIEYSKPELVLYHNVGVGQLENKSLHTDVALKSFEKGFFESGLGLNNIIRFKYANVAYYNLSGSVFYRYGAYHLPNSADNLFLKMTFSFEF